MAKRPVLDISGANGGNLLIEKHQVEIVDADSKNPTPSLASHGFCAIPFAAEPPADQVSAAYRQEFARLSAAAVKEHTGAAIVLGMPLMVQARHSNAGPVDGPISICHCDFTPTAAAMRCSQVLAQLPKPPGRVRRFAAFNVWWLARGGTQDRPLALCDATTLLAPDLQAGNAKVMAPDHSRAQNEIAFPRYSPRHRWYWYSKLTPERMLLFAGFDSDPSMPSMVAHSAFANSACPPDVPPRVSIEGRCFAFW